MTKKKKFDIYKISNFIVSIGASIVILGALAKITHHHLADIMLTIGLVTEAAIFVMYAFLPPEKTHEEKLLASLLRETKTHHQPAQSGQSSTIDTKPIEMLNETLHKIFNLKK